MSAQEFKPGDRVRCIETWTTHVIDSGDEFTVEDVDPTTRNGLEVFVQGEWVPARYFEKVEPAPMFKPGDPVWIYPAELDGKPAWAIQRQTDATEPEDKDDLYVEPEPLKEGDWVQVWAKFVREDNLGALVVATPTGAGGEGCRNTYASPDAIIRTNDAPPWVNAAEKAAIAEVLASEGHMGRRAAKDTAESLFRAGVRVTEGGAS